tara:strand:- start:719 stop:1393 length:675 start_codon:yes stop_codon:yes gene_type:complete
MEIFFPSICAGLSQAIVGHPMDTAKVLIQNNIKLRNLTINDYYKGFKYPLLLSLLFNGTVFPSYEYLNNNINNSFLTGGLVGIIVTPLVFTCETIKILKQINKQITKKKLLNTNGLITTLTRESLAMSIYFSSYNYFKKHDYNSFIGGSMSGFSNWLVTYPIDVIKTRQIAQQISFTEAYKQGYLYKGLSITLFRAVLVNGCIFFTYEQSNKLFNKKNKYNSIK